MGVSDSSRARATERAVRGVKGPPRPPHRVETVLEYQFSNQQPYTRDTST
eukprot:CAMPEP_0205955576 /NCGR_PEP_ID=MMETSP1459-20131121/32193_1 /ASSEMBLY_ACC=CAM_ASM_001120 /TAXON_ID=41880 /ORGANISM="Pycnococcus provasolii, Strain RCC931" /LENGTH=49 /DNA_ID= /DNA_START= /DNA_END= /DNA_ORIENTATION=